MRISSVGTTLVIITALLLPLFFVFAQSETVETDVSIENEAPSIETLDISDTPNGADAFESGITPNPGSIKSIYINGIVTDLNGASTTATTSVVFYRSSVSGGNSCVDDNNDCYSREICVIDDTYGTSLEAQYSCQLDLQYWIDATDISGRFPDDEWIAEVTATDIIGSSTVATTSVEINSLLSLDLPSNITYGVLPLGATTTAGTNIELAMTQSGNAQTDIEISGTDMTCTDMGIIPAGNQKWSLDDVGYDHASTTSLSNTPARTYRGVPYRDSETQEVTRSLYLNLAIPSSGVSGVCTGSNTLTVLATTDTGGGSGSGTLLDDIVSGVWYESPSHKGFTRDDGTFDFEEDETIIFKIGGLTIGSIYGEDIATDGLVFIQELFGADRTHIRHIETMKLARLLQTLDKDGDSSNGIVITRETHNRLASWQMDIRDLTIGRLTALVRVVVGRSTHLRDEDTAARHLEQTLRKYGIINGNN